ncbi:hypothetical protein NT6N_18650 [Oceaniferula spumae]|uniref:ATP-binding protein n=1 Tax=Oceaniferula spumae TaxID=2979115 RepID=A0AAT9FLH6_9BACT
MTARDNPFATDRAERLLRFRSEWIGSSMSELTSRWEKLHRRAAITGRHGAGKSTLLDSWATHLGVQNQPVTRLFLNRDTRTLTPDQWHAIEDCHGKTILLDGEGHLSWKERRKVHQLSQNAAGLLVTRHKKGSLPILCHLNPDIEILHRCVRKLAPEEYPSLAPNFPRWWKQHRGNIRDILLECYDSITRCHMQ